jgi:DNA-binding MarR family transcriptional regulator
MSVHESLVGLACQVNDHIALALQPVLKKHHLTPATFDLLSSVRAGDGRETQAEIGKRVGLSRATVSEAISALQSEGLVTRTPCKKDSRAVLLGLTSTGHQRVSAVLSEIKRIETVASKELGEKEAEYAARALRKLVAVIRLETES